MWRPVHTEGSSAAIILCPRYTLLESKGRTSVTCCSSSSIDSACSRPRRSCLKGGAACYITLPCLHLQEAGIFPL